MPKHIYVNLHVKDLERSIAFFTKLGYAFNPQFTDEKAACLIISDTIFVMLLVEPFFESFTKKPVCDTSNSIEAIMGLSTESREAVDEIVEKAIAAGGISPNPPYDHDFMYGRGFTDLDGHQWEYMFMEAAAVNNN